MKKELNGLSYRKKREGKETQLIRLFFENVLSNIFEIREDLNILILEEPKIANNYPDILIISYDKTKLNFWNDDRNQLSNNDIKLVHHLYKENNKKRIEDLLWELGLTDREVENILYRLLKADCIEEYNNKFSIKNREDIFFIKDIISIEAKISQWKKVIQQANLNNIFSSESYILLPEMNLNKEIMDISERKKIGIITTSKKQNKLWLKSQENNIPKSYFSWIINELIGRDIYNERIRCN